LGADALGRSLCGTGSGGEARALMAAISTLRETGVIRAAIIGAFVLGERPWKQRVMAAVWLALGVALITEFS